MTSEESAALMEDPTFRGRIRVFILDYTTYILNEAPTVEGHPARYRWAQRAAANSMNEAQQIQPMVVMDGQVQQDGKDIADPQLKTSVQTVINKFI